MTVQQSTRVEAQPPLTEIALRKLRSDVLAGNLEAGSKLKIDTLQQEYAISSSPLREALSRLTQEGLVRSDERKGFRVAPISIEDLEDITRMRLMLDIEALQESIAMGDDEWEATVVAAFYRLERTESKLSDGPVLLDENWTELHRNFHMALISACPSERLLNWCASLFDQAERYRRLSARIRPGSRRKSNEHKRIMDAVLKRDEGTACELLRDHITRTKNNVEISLKK